MVCPWPFMASLDASIQQSPEPEKSFAQAVSDSCDLLIHPLPPKVIMGDMVRVKITQAELESGIADCRMNLHGRITLAKGDTTWTTQALKIKLSSLWPTLREWSVLPLGRGFFDFKFGSVEDMRKVWAMGAVNLKPGILRFFSWTKAFKPQNQAQTHAQIWVRLMQLPQEYWRKKTLFEIASGLGTPLTIDEATLSRRFGLFARVLVDVDLSAKLFESVLVESEGLALPISVQYERLPLFCVQCKMLGHSIQNCKKMHQDFSTKVVKKVPNAVLQKKPNANLETINTTQANQNPNANNIVQLASESIGIDRLSLIQEQDRAIDGEAVTAVIHDSIQDPTLALHNSFDLLENELVDSVGEADGVVMDIVQEQFVSNITKQDDIPILQANNTLFSSAVYPSATMLLDKVISDQAAKVNAPGKPYEDSEKEELTLEGIHATVPLQVANLRGPGSSSKVDEVNGTRQNALLDQDENLPPDGSLAVGEYEKSLSSQTNMPDSLVTSTAMAMPLTSYSVLTMDKRPFVAHTAMANAPSKKAMESVRILKKLWGDLSSDDQESEIGSDRYVDGNIEKDENYTPYTAKRQKKKEKLQRTRVNSNEAIQTRSKKGAKKDISQ